MHVYLRNPGMIYNKTADDDEHSLHLTDMR